MPSDMLEDVKPPLPEQQQAVPGETRALHPRPDHGEESYRGSGRLEGKKAIVTGGDVPRPTLQPYATTI